MVPPSCVPFPELPEKKLALLDTGQKQSMRWYVNDHNLCEVMTQAPLSHTCIIVPATPQMLNHMAEMDLYDLYVPQPLPLSA